MNKMDTKTLTETEETRRGELIARILKLKHSREYPDRYNTEWGTKTALGLFRIMARLVEDGE
jgi:hypothetical protein